MKATGAQLFDVLSLAPMEDDLLHGTMASNPLLATGEVVEVLPVFGVAHVRIEGGRLLGLNRQTPGVVLGELQVGQRVKLEVERRFLRVTNVELVG